MEKNMKIALLNTANDNGGAAIAVKRLGEALRQSNIDSRMIVMYKFGDDLYSNSIDKYKYSKLLSRIKSYLDSFPKYFYRKRINNLFSSGLIGNNILQNDVIKQVDIIHLHWINAGFLSIKNIYNLSKLKAPIVWTLHDMWAFTGGCHYSYKCNGYKDKCGNCYLLNSNLSYDLSRIIWKMKFRYFRKLNITVVTPSKWLAKCARESTIFRDNRIITIPNCINTNIYKPIDKNIARDLLNIPKRKKYILFGAMSSTTDKRKGFKYLSESLKILGNNHTIDKNNIELLVFGASYSREIGNLPFNVRFLGRLYDDYSLILVYNAADVFICPSVQDNLPNTIVESLSCGLPVIGFNIGGIPDMIDHKNNGYIAKYKSPKDIANGLLYILNIKNRIQLENNARKKAIDNYSYNNIVKKYLKLYNDLRNHE